MLSRFLPGLGQMYNGQLARGLCLLAALLLATFISVNSGLWNTFHGFCLGLLLAAFSRSAWLWMCFRGPEERKRLL